MNRFALEPRSEAILFTARDTTVRLGNSSQEGIFHFERG
jgi:hypothetical protein